MKIDILYWYRYDIDEKDFEVKTVEADSFEEGIRIVKDEVPCSFYFENITKKALN